MNNTVLFLCVLGLSGSIALAETAGKQDPSIIPPMMTTEQRQKMADAHEKMATCLRSDKTLSECHDQMMKSCSEHMGKDGCPMMHGKMHHKMMHDGKKSLEKK